MTDVEFLTIDDIVELIRALRIGPIRDIGHLDSPVNRPRASAFGEDVYSTLPLKAAALVHSLRNNDALVDGNERLAWLATVVFCDLNGDEADLSDEQAFALVWDTASSSQSVEDIAEGLHVRPHKADH